MNICRLWFHLCRWRWIVIFFSKTIPATKLKGVSKLLFLLNLSFKLFSVRYPRQWVCIPHIRWSLSPKLVGASRMILLVGPLLCFHSLFLSSHLTDTVKNFQSALNVLLLCKVSSCRLVPFWFWRLLWLLIIGPAGVTLHCEYGSFAAFVSQLFLGFLKSFYLLFIRFLLLRLCFKVSLLFSVPCLNNFDGLQLCCCIIGLLIIFNHCLFVLLSPHAVEFRFQFTLDFVVSIFFFEDALN